MRHKIKIFIIALSVIASSFALLANHTAYAAVCDPTDPVCTNTAPTNPATTSPLSSDCAGKSDKQCLQNNPIVHDLNIVVNFLSGLVGIAVVGVIILGGVQYAAAGDKADAVSAAKKRITDGLIALVAYLFVFAFLQWLIPGGIFK